MTKKSDIYVEKILQFMERHGDLHRCQRTSDTYPNTVNLWLELTKLLNNSIDGEPRSIEKWKKVWTDLKFVASKKYQKIKEGKTTSIWTETDSRVMKIITETKNKKSREGTFTLLGEESIEVENDVQNTQKIDNDSLTPSNNRLPSPQFFFVNEDTMQRESPRERKSSVSSSSSNESEPPVKRIKCDKQTDEQIVLNGMKEMVERFFDYGRERERMAHEQEMALINCNNNLVTVLSRVTNVLETLAPSVRRFLDSQSKEIP